MPNWVGCCRTLTPCVEVALLVCGVSYPLSLHQSREGSWFCQVQDLTTFFTPAECFFSGVFGSDYGLLGPFMVTFLPDPVAFSINCAQLFQCINLQGAFFNWSQQDFLRVRLHSKSHQKSSKCQNLLTGWQFFG